MSLKSSSRSKIWGIAVLLSLLSISMLVSCSTAGSMGSTEDGSAQQGDSSADSGQLGEALGEAAGSAGDLSGEGTPISSCPEGPIFMEVQTFESWAWAPGGQEEFGQIDGGGTVTCMVEISGSKVTGEVNCYFDYSNEGTLHGDSGSCDIKGQGVALAKISGSCDNFTLTLHVEELTAGDETGEMPLDATMKCGNKTTPYLTFYPRTYVTFDVPLRAGEFEYVMEKRACMVDFVECSKKYFFRVHDAEFQE